MVELAAPTLFKIGWFPITNTFLDTILIDILLITGLFFLNKHLKEIPGMFQNLIEVIVETFYGLAESVAGKNVGQIFPYFISFFTFILLANWLGLFPGFGTIGFYEIIDGHKQFIPLLRAAPSDINVTLSLALIATVATHVMAVRTIGWKQYLSRYFSLNPIFLFVGLLEILSVFTNIISLSFRLFGNILAGEVVLTTVSNMFAFFLPLPFMSLEIIVGLVQALVFAMLTMAFMSILATPHNEGGEH